MSSKNNLRSPSHGLKPPPNTKSMKPLPLPLHRRCHSYNPHYSIGHSHGSSGTLSIASNKKVIAEVINLSDDDEYGMASFPQFCAMCEKQIVTPGTTVLYCSEACRRKDAPKPTSTQTQPPPTEGLAAPPSYDLKLSPTVSRPTAPSKSVYSDLYAAESDSTTTDRFRRQFSPAAHYLSRLDFDTTCSNNPASCARPIRRATILDHSTLPALSHTPSSASSMSSSSTSSSYRRLNLSPNPSDPHLSSPPINRPCILEPTPESSENSTPNLPSYR